ncbi:hypothetical protein GCM10010277_73590 [Streptomyces longisporoflavus]|uniref:hypothetical protein n=1 Tax=Streptomyces longisporoflavus TaxID=28044 RepID=UPI00167E43CC|nr:hypothetical protein [Streptomyces longisporoflavus]GGV66041.1 hypothetical protein GCM10010277_73590 [Streptomyces longisporoflavus]
MSRQCSDIPIRNRSLDTDDARQLAREGRWPARTRKLTHRAGLIRLEGAFDDGDLQRVRATAPARQVTRDGAVILIWPPGTVRITLHLTGVITATGYFEDAEIAALRQFLPGRTLTHTRDQLTVWPTEIRSEP